eukprot:gene7748-8590_t
MEMESCIESIKNNRLEFMLDNYKTQLFDAKVSRFAGKEDEDTANRHDGRSDVGLLSSVSDELSFVFGTELVHNGSLECNTSDDSCFAEIDPVESTKRLSLCGQENGQQMTEVEKVDWVTIDPVENNNDEEVDGYFSSSVTHKLIGCSYRSSENNTRLRKLVVKKGSLIDKGMDPNDIDTSVIVSSLSDVTNEASMTNKHADICQCIKNSTFEETTSNTNIAEGNSVEDVALGKVREHGDANIMIDIAEGGRNRTGSFASKIRKMSLRLSKVTSIITNNGQNKGMVKSKERSKSTGNAATVENNNVDWVVNESDATTQIKLPVFERALEIDKAGSMAEDCTGSERKSMRSSRVGQDERKYSNCGILHHSVIERTDNTADNNGRGNLGVEREGNAIVDFTNEIVNRGGAVNRGDGGKSIEDNMLQQKALNNAQDSNSNGSCTSMDISFGNRLRAKSTPSSMSSLHNNNDNNSKENCSTDSGIDVMNYEQDLPHRFSFMMATTSNL